MDSLKMSLVIPCLRLAMLLCIVACGEAQSTSPAEDLGTSSSAAMLGASGIPGRSDQFVRSGSVLYWRFTEGAYTSAASQHDYVYEGNFGVPLISDPAVYSIDSFLNVDLSPYHSTKEL